MKKISFYIILLISSAITSCVSLDEEPRSNISSNQFYKTPADANSAVISIYNAFSHNTSADHASIYNRLLTLAVGMTTDDHIPGVNASNPDVRSLAVLTQSASNDRYSQLWKQLYDGINRANIAIDRIPAIEGDTTSTNRLVREAKFLRGLLYFDLVRLWGDVPLVLHETTSLTKDALLVSRNSADEVYAQIIKDWTDAEALPWSYPKGDTNAGRATGAAATGFLAQLYLTRANTNEDNRPANVSTIANRNALLQLAIDKSNQIINKSGRYYDLFADYADVFKKSSKNGVEHIFSAQFKSNSNMHGNSYAQRNAALGIKDANGVTVVNGTLGDAPTTDLLAKFNKHGADKRRAVTLTSTYTVNGVTYTIDPKQNAGFTQVINKYYDPEVANNLIESGINVPILKYSDILYINAEANNELYGPNAEAHTNYNKLRTRAGLTTLTLGNYTKDQFRDSVYLDLRLENTHEYRRWFDLIREIDKDGNHIMVPVLRAAGKPAAADKHYWYPIPQTELDMNPKLVQNPGW